MSPEPPPTPESRHAKPLAIRAGLGRHIFGLGIMALGLVGLVWGDFITGQPVPNDFPHRIALAYIVAAFLLCTGIIMQWRRSASVGAAALAAYYLVIVIIVMHGPVLLARFKEYGVYEGLAEQFAIAAAALIVYATTARIPAPLAARLTLIGQLTLGLCALIFGGAHFVYMNFTAPLVPKWLPPSQVFWGYLTGVAFILAGLALLSRIQARLAANLLTAMLASFTLLVHLRMLFTDHKLKFNWTELAINLAILGAAWIVADSFASPNPHHT
ncbi:hypothetical protein [Granulicella sp. L46]|uniref:hypothetical protein n=1 Tax=Granulicella sp. L46 TaxID=1641865 RepID=UPI00131D747B|nr:hypothetical protein [Granulicella sp. L46]